MVSYATLQGAAFWNFLEAAVGRRWCVMYSGNYMRREYVL